ncbi:PilZ domain-containing protein [Chitinimonas sp.]|uniref:PilZ domain-containing protein n=1 Tax=Chitinimonas sp. TaxID=1934313 RepID=UPI0035B0A69E
MSAADRRASERIPVHWRAAVQPDQGGALLYGYTVGISAGGLGVLVEKALPVLSGCTLYLEIMFPGQTERNQIAVQAQVMNVILADSRFRTGLRFLNLPPNIRDSIDRFVKSRTDRWMRN